MASLHSTTAAGSSKTATTTTTSTASRVQTVIFVRHGVAQHNFHGADLSSPSLFDPPLVQEGKVGALSSGQKIKLWLLQTYQLTVELVICSPLTRCLQTAVLAFLPGEYDSTIHGTTTTRSKCVPFLCMEEVREAYGKHYPDKRRPKSFLQNHWPMVRFESEMTEQDELWSEHHRESYKNILARIDQFLEKLCHRPEQCIVVVSHGVWIEALLHKYQPHVLKGGTIRVHNSNAYATQCLSNASTGKFMALQNTRFIG